MQSHTIYELQQEIKRLKRKVEILAETVSELDNTATSDMKLELTTKVNKAGVAISDAVVYANAIQSKMCKF